MGEVTGATASTNQVVLLRWHGQWVGKTWEEIMHWMFVRDSSLGCLEQGKCSGEFDGQTRELLEEVIAGYSGSWGYILNKKVLQVKRSSGNLKFWEKPQKRGKRKGGKLFWNSCLGLTLVLNQSFLFPQRGTLRQGPKIDLGMFQALYGVASNISHYFPSENLVLKQSQKPIIFLYSLAVKVCISGTNFWSFNQTETLISSARCG